MGRLAELDRRLSQASDPVRDRATPLIDQLDRLLDQAEDDQAWAEQIGPAYTAGQVAELLDVSRQAVAKRSDLLRLAQRNGRTVYPAFQFDGDHPLDGIRTVLLTLQDHVATPWTIASWLTSPQKTLDGRRPIDAMRIGDVSPTVQAAERFAATLKR